MQELALIWPSTSTSDLLLRNADLDIFFILIFIFAFSYSHATAQPGWSGNKGAWLQEVTERRFRSDLIVIRFWPSVVQLSEIAFLMSYVNNVLAFLVILSLSQNSKQGLSWLSGAHAEAIKCEIQSKPGFEQILPFVLHLFRKSIALGIDFHICIWPSFRPANISCNFGMQKPRMYSSISYHSL